MSDAPGPGTLWVCAVPIGTIDDASARLRRVLGEVDAIACEDTRVTGRLLHLLGIAAPRLLSHHAHNERAGAAGVVALLAAGSSIALVSDAGTPAVSDPGAQLVAAARGAGIRVLSVPGPSAVAAAVGTAGLDVRGAGYTFVGFLPRTEQALRALALDHAAQMVVAFDSPQRVARSLAAVAAVQPQRQATVVRELGKLHEAAVTGSATEVAIRLAGAPQRGEFVVVLAPCVPAAPSVAADRAHVDLVMELADAGLRAKDACRIVAGRLGGSSRQLYAAVQQRRIRDAEDPAP